MAVGDAAAEARAALVEAVAALVEVLAKSDTVGELPAPPANSPLASLADRFALSDFEVGCVLLGAASELDAGFRTTCARLNGSVSHDLPTLGMALTVLPSADWSALTPDAPLRRRRLIELGPGEVLLQRPMTIDERVLHHLTGSDYLDDRIERRIVWCDSTGALPASHDRVADQVAEIYGTEPIHLWTPTLEGGEPVAAAAMAQRGLSLARIRPAAIPTDPAELDTLVQLAQREASLGGFALLVDLDEATDPTQRSAAKLVASGLGERALTCGVDPLAGEAVRRLRLPLASFDDRLDQWRSALKGVADIDGLESLVARFVLDSAALQAAVAELDAGLTADPDADPIDLLWAAAKAQAHARLEDLAQRLDARRAWTDLVLPDGVTSALRALLGHARHKAKIDHEWGFTAIGERGGGSAALFAGPSGTGKTLAAEVLATELDLDLYRIDLSAVVSKFIGETEKNLRRVFDAAEAGGAVLLFDEADALFGKRTEVKDSHDRHANIEVSYLLQRMESFSGLALLTTNHRKHLDPAFLRRIPFVIEFPFPDTSARRAIWQLAFPSATPIERLDFARLAQLSVTGGSIRSIARNAAALAAEADSPVTMALIRDAVALEYAKLGKPVTPTELVGWP